MTVSIATVLAGAASTAFTLGLYLMKRAAARLPSLGGGWRLAAWAAFVRDPGWLAGAALQGTGYGLYLVALRGAPLAVVHTALNAGIAAFVVLAAVGLGEPVSRREWGGVAAIVLGLCALGLSLPGTTTGAGAPQHLRAFACGLVAVAVVVPLCDRTPGRAVGLSVAAGLVLGLGGVFAKGLAGAVSVGAALGLVDLPLTMAANAVGFALMQAALQAGRGAVTVPIFSMLSDLVPIVASALVFGEPLPQAGAAATLRPLSYGLALGGAMWLAISVQPPVERTALGVAGVSPPDRGS